MSHVACHKPEDIRIVNIGQTDVVRLLIAHWAAISCIFPKNYLRETPMTFREKYLWGILETFLLASPNWRKFIGTGWKIHIVTSQPIHEFQENCQDLLQYIM